MRTTPRPRAALRRSLASLTAALLLLGTIATPSLAGIEGPDDEGDPTAPAAEVDDLAAAVAVDEIDEATEEEADVVGEPVPEAAAVEAATLAPAATDPPLEVAQGDGGQHCPHDGPGAPPGAVNAASGELTIDGVTIRWSGDPGVVVITNPTDLDATVVWCAKGGNNFAGDGSQVIGEMRTSIAAGDEATEGPFGTEISYLVVYRVEFDEPDEPDTITIELRKAWFDLDGLRVEAPDVAWGIELSAGPPDAEEILATLPGDDNVAEVALLEHPDGSPAPARYGITETPAPAGWEAVDCDDLDVGELTWLNQGTSAMLVASGADSGAFGAMESGVHLVCNQQVEEPDEPVVITLQKAWFDVDGQPLAAPDVGWSLTMTVSEDGVTDTVVAELPGDDAAAEFTAGDRYGVQEELIPDGWEPVACDTVDLDAVEPPADAVVAQNTSRVSVALGAPDGTFVATDSGVHLVCNQEVVEVLPIDVEKPDVEQPETEPTAEKPETEPAEKAIEVEVLAAELPRTGAGLALLASLAAGLMILGGVGLAAGGRKGGTRR